MLRNSNLAARIVRTNSPAVSLASAASKGSTTTASIPVSASNLRRSAKRGDQPGASAGRKKCSGCGSKVIATARAPAARASSTTAAGILLMPQVHAIKVADGCNRRTKPRRDLFYRAINSGNNWVGALDHRLTVSVRPVIGQRNPVGQSLICLCMAEFVRNMRQPRVLCANSFRPPQRLLHGCMARMRFMPQRGENQVIKPFKQPKTLLREFRSHPSDRQRCPKRNPAIVICPCRTGTRTNSTPCTVIPFAQRFQLDARTIRIGGLRRKGILVDVLQHPRHIGAAYSGIGPPSRNAVKLNGRKSSSPKMWSACECV